MDPSAITLKVIILGAGKGGTALLELFPRSPGIEVVGVADSCPQAPGLGLARALGIPTYEDGLALVRENRADLIVDVTGDAEMGRLLHQHRPPRAEILGGKSALLVWRLAQHERELRDQLIQSEKLASIGTLASGIAHEINNPLYAITGLSELLRDESRPEVMKEYIDEIIQAGQRITTIVRDLNAYARRAPNENVCDLDLNHMLDEAVKMARRATVLDEVEVVTLYTAAMATRGNPDELLQVFINLVTNAVQAMEGRGTLTLSTTESDGHVIVSVKDTGPGIPRHHLGQVFDPFFTTKEQGKGTGLGLHIVRDIVSRNRGQVAAESVLGQGATFKIILPAIVR
jgi:signal transduction histidine kinase